MDICLPIRDIYVRKILDSGGSPAVEAEVLAGEDIVGTASVAGQKGEQEIEAGIEQMHSQIAEELIGKNLFEQEEIDHLLEKRKEIPQEVSLAVSIATARAAAGKLKLSLYRYLGGTHALKLPALLILAADGTAEETEMDFRELMLVPKGISSVQGQIRAAGEIDSLFREALKKRNGREGEPDRKKQDAADGGVLKLLEKAVEEAGYQCGKEIFFAVNAGAGRLYEKQSGVYRFPAESRRCGQRVERSREELIEYLTRLTGEYPISLLEDPLYREDREGIQELEKKLEDREDCEKKTVCYDRSRRNLYPDRTFGACTGSNGAGKRNYFMQAAEGNRRCGTCRCSGCIWNRADEAWKSGMPGGGSEVQSSFEAGRKAGKIVGNGLSLS